MPPDLAARRADRAPAVLLPYQQRFIADTSPVRLCEKSRRVGMSWGVAAEAALTAAASSGMDVWYVGYNRDMAEEFIRDAADWAKHYDQAATEVQEELWSDVDDEGNPREVLTFVIRFASGFRVTALTSRPSSLRGKQGLVILDEAAFHPALPELLKAAMALLMWGGRVVIISTHDGVDNAFNELVTDVRAGKRRYSLHRITLDDALSDGLYRRICLRLKRDWTLEAEATWRAELLDFYGDGAEEELFCVPRSSGGAYLARALVEARMVEAPVVRLALDDAFVHGSDAGRAAFIAAWCEKELLPLLAALPADCRHGFGEDFGRSGDLTVVAPITVTRTLVRRVPFLVELRNVPFRQQEQVLFFIVDRLPRLAGGALDARGNGQYLAEVAAQRYGASHIEQVMLSDKWYLEHMPRFKAALEDATLEVPRDDDVLQDLRQLQVIRGVPKLGDDRRKGHDGGDRHGDAAVALALAYRASLIDAAPIEFRALGISRTGSAGELTVDEGRGFGAVTRSTDTRGF